MPGSVGSAACALWQQLAPCVGGRRRFSVWPFEGDLKTLLRSTSVIVGEIYPRAAYATALLDVPPASRAPLVIAKTDARVRGAAPIYRCPIAGCDKVYAGSRGGCDAHVGSLRTHPAWHPELRDSAERTRRFRQEFPGFFRS